MPTRTHLAADGADAERAPLIPTNSSKKQPRVFAHRSAKCAILCTLILFIIAALTWYYTGHLEDGRTILRYPGESVTWEPCGDKNGLSFECSSIDVPMNHFDAVQSANKTFSIPLIRQRGRDNATANILFNPGGPGGSGVEFLRSWAPSFRKVLGAANDFHLVSFDPRGVGASLPAAVCFGDSVLRRAHPVVATGEVEHDARVYDQIGQRTRACAEHMGEHGVHVNTKQTAADMNSILDAVGQKSLYYWGFSYGTVLGQTYATLFPERAERVVIDGVVNHFDWFLERDTDAAMQDTDAVIAGFFDECAKAGPDCPLSEHGDSGADIERNVTSFLAGIRDSPAAVYVNSTTFGSVSETSIKTRGFFLAAYSRRLWWPLADAVAQLMRGNGTAALLLASTERAAATSDEEQRREREDISGEKGLFVRYNDGMTGAAAWPGGREAAVKYARERAAAVAARTWMPPLAGFYLQQAQWQAAAAAAESEAFRPAREVVVATRHPLLVLSTTYDPVCPLASARGARRVFAGARLVEVRGYGHCALSVPSACAAVHVRAYFERGTMPEEEHVLCDDVDGPYFVDPKKRDEGKVAAMGEGEEERALRAALEDLSGAVPVPGQVGHVYR